MPTWLIYFKLASKNNQELFTVLVEKIAKSFPKLLNETTKFFVIITMLNCPIGKDKKSKMHGWMTIYKWLLRRLLSAWELTRKMSDLWFIIPCLNHLKDMCKNAVVQAVISYQQSVFFIMIITIGREMTTLLFQITRRMALEKRKIFEHFIRFSSIARSHISVDVRCNLSFLVRISIHKNVKVCVTTVAMDLELLIKTIQRSPHQLQNFSIKWHILSQTLLWKWL